MNRLLNKLKLNCLWLNWEIRGKNWYCKSSSLKRWCRLMYILTNRNGIKGSVWNPTCLWHGAKEIAVSVRLTTYGEFVLSFSFAVVLFIFSRVPQTCTGHTFYPWKGWNEKRVIWISGFPHVRMCTPTLFCWCSVYIFTVPNADYTEEGPALLLNTALQT